MSPTACSNCGLTTAAAAYANRGWAYGMLDKKAKAIADFEKFITLIDDPELIKIARQMIEEFSK